MNKSICICGGGQIGTVIAGVAGSKGYDIRIYTGHPSEWSNVIKVKLPEGETISAKILATDDAALAVNGAETVLLCLPGYMIEKTIADIAPFLSSGTAVGSVVCSTGFLNIAKEILPSDIPLFGFQRVPFISFREKYGYSAILTDRRKLQKMTFLNMSQDVKSRLISTFEDITNNPVKEIGYLEASITNSNPILHPSCCYALFHNWDGNILPRRIFMYEEWDDFNSEVYVNCDSDLQRLIGLLPMDRTEVPPVLEYYESKTLHDLTLKMRSIEAFKGVSAPMKEIEGGFIPDFSHRFFTEDFPFGLQLIKNLAVEHTVATPYIDKVLEWGHSINVI